MKIHYIQPPENHNIFLYYNPVRLTENNFSRLKELQIDEIWYWYVEGNISNFGYLLMRKGQDYDYLCLAHIFDRNPIESATFEPQTLEDICAQLRYNKEVLDYLKHTFDLLNPLLNLINKEEKNESRKENNFIT